MYPVFLLIGRKSKSNKHAHISFATYVTCPWPDFLCGDLHVWYSDWNFSYNIKVPK